AGKDRRLLVQPHWHPVFFHWLRLALEAYLFSQPEPMEEHRVAQRMSRKSPVQPSQRHRKKTAPRKSPGDRYTTESYRRAIAYGCDMSFPHPSLSSIRPKDRTADQTAELKDWQSARRWHPHQLRHNAATLLRKEFGLDVSRCV